MIHTQHIALRKRFKQNDEQVQLFYFTSHTIYSFSCIWTYPIAWPTTTEYIQLMLVNYELRLAKTLFFLYFHDINDMGKTQTAFSLDLHSANGDEKKNLNCTLNKKRMSSIDVNDNNQMQRLMVNWISVCELAGEWTCWKAKINANLAKIAYTAHSMHTHLFINCEYVWSKYGIFKCVTLSNMRAWKSSSTLESIKAIAIVWSSISCNWSI